MLNHENKILCWNLLAKYGVALQKCILIEECAELQKAVCKMIRAADEETEKYFLENFKEELVDVIVMCQEMLLSENMSMDEVNRRAREKLERALK